jgi:hypothetical protein
LGILVKCPKNEGSNCFCEKMLFGIKARSNWLEHFVLKSVLKNDISQMC